MKNTKLTKKLIQRYAEIEKQVKQLNAEKKAINDLMRATLDSGQDEVSFKGLTLSMQYVESFTFDKESLDAEYGLGTYEKHRTKQVLRFKPTIKAA